MTGLFGWLGRERPDAAVALGMACALQVHDGEAWDVATVDALSIGVLDGVDASSVGEWAAPAWSADRRHALWLAGEIFEAPGLDLDTPQQAAATAVREALLARLRAGGPAVLRDVDGEYQIAWWDRGAHRLRLFGDRFGGLPLYWTATASGFAFACGVRGVLMAPGAAAEPDLDAIAEAATFGGYRLGARTSVASVRMVPGAADLTVEAGSVSVRRYWTWSDLGEPVERSPSEAIDQLDGLWRRAVARRVRGTSRPGQTLSGGLDSRLILAEAAPRSAGWTAITFGIPGCDDERIARRAVRAIPVSWRFVPLYEGDWLERRSQYIQPTDGLIQLGDLVHLETLPLQHELMDAHLSGYVGDVVAGTTFARVRTAEDALILMPYYETALGLGWTGALARLEASTADAAWLSSPRLYFEHKAPQAANRWTAAWRPWLRVRKPFVDYRFFDYCQTCTPALRVDGRIYERWLRLRYPTAFRIPNQRTGAPAAAGSLALSLARARRVARRSWRRVARAAGLPLRPWSRAYVNDDVEWGRAGVRDRIRAVILRPGSIAASVWGRDRLSGVVDGYLQHGHGPAQVIGALYTFEAYHRDLPAHLARARRRAAALVECNG